MHLVNPVRIFSPLRTSRPRSARTASALALLCGSLSLGLACKAASSPAAPVKDAPAPAPETPAARDAAPSGTKVAAAGAGRPLTVEEAHRLMPRADPSGLSAEQLGILFEVAGDTFDYAGCNSTLAACLRADVKDKHAPRMAALASMLIRDGHAAGVVVDLLERYYASFAQAKRVKLKSDDCGTLGPPVAPVAVVEFSDYQCPHCATAVVPLHQMVEKAAPNVRLCSKYFPLAQHPRAAIAAGCAEYARSKGKFWLLSNLMFEHQEELDDANLKAYAQQVGLNGAEMLKQAYAGKFDALIEAHKAEATGAGLRATPTFYFNGRTLTLPTRLDYLLFTVDDELEWQRNSGAWEKE